MADDPRERPCGRTVLHMAHAYGEHHEELCPGNLPSGQPLLTGTQHAEFERALTDQPAGEPPPAYRLSLAFGAADDAQAARYAMAWADTLAAEYGMTDPVVRRADGSVITDADSEIPAADPEAPRPSDWPPRAGDVWQDRSGLLWFATLVGPRDAKWMEMRSADGQGWTRLQWQERFAPAKLVWRQDGSAPTPPGRSADEVREAIGDTLAPWIRKDYLHGATDQLMDRIGPLITALNSIGHRMRTAQAERDEQRQRAEHAEQYADAAEGREALARQDAADAGAALARAEQQVAADACVLDALGGAGQAAINAGGSLKDGVQADLAERDATIARIRGLRERYARGEERLQHAVLNPTQAPRFFAAVLRDLDAALDGTDSEGANDES